MAGPTLFESMQNSIISDGVFCSLTPAAIYKLSLTCKVANEAADSYRRCAWNIGNHLRRFFNDPFAFRSLQARTDTIIYGSVALQFFSRTYYPDSDLEICVPLQHFLEVGQWLMNADVGYRFHPLQNQDPEFAVNAGLVKEENHMQAENTDDASTGVSAIFTFIRSHDGGNPVQIQMSVAQSSILQVVFKASSTCLMNFITFDKACSLYPQSSFEECRSLITMHKEGSHKSVIQECEERGWKMDTDPSCTNLSMTCPNLGTRWVGDKFCWTIPLSLERLLCPEPSQPLPIELNGWSLTPTRRENPRILPNKDWRTRCIVLRSPGLKFIYMLPKSLFWENFLSQSSPANPNVASDDAFIRTHIEFCRRFSNTIDSTVHEEQRGLHAVLVAHNEDLEKIKIRLDECEKKIAEAQVIAEIVREMGFKVEWCKENFERLRQSDSGMG